MESNCRMMVRSLSECVGVVKGTIVQGCLIMAVVLTPHWTPNASLSIHPPISTPIRLAVIISHAVIACTLSIKHRSSQRRQLGSHPLVPNYPQR